MDFRITTLDMPDDYEGRVTATLIEAHPAVASTRGVLYIHGFSDYFFQEHFAQHMVGHGLDFYALDLRKYGRSYLPHQHFNYCRDMREYFAEIDAAIETMQRAGDEDITLIGHSTGGLLAAYYAVEGAHRNALSRVILNSPFMEFNVNRIVRCMVIPAACAVGRIFPYASVEGKPAANNFRSIHRSQYGEWDFDTSLKPASQPLYLAWMRAVRIAQRRLRRGAGITIPVLVMHAARSTRHSHWDDEARTSDTVLNVDDIARYGARLGTCVTFYRAEGGMHDLVLSQASVRKDVMERMTQFIDNGR